MKHLRCTKPTPTLSKNGIYLVRLLKRHENSYVEVDSLKKADRITTRNDRGRKINTKPHRFEPVKKVDEPEFWVTGLGNRIRISKLTDRHLRNIHKMLLRWNYWKVTGDRKLILDKYMGVIEKEVSRRKRQQQIGQNYEI